MSSVRTALRDRVQRFVIALILSCTCFAGADVAGAQAELVHNDLSSVERAKVLRVKESETRVIPGTETAHLYQTLEAELLTGSKAGERIVVANDFLELEAGDRFFVIHYTDVDGTETYSVQDVDRRGALAILLVLFVGMIVVFGGWYGVRALASLAVSLYVLAYVLVPGLVAGWPPLATSFVVAASILAGAIYLTHGFNRESTIAFLGTLAAVGATLLFAAWSVSFTALSGFSADESVYLNFNTRGTLDLVALLVGGIVIGAIGVLDDVAITQVAVVRELLASAGHEGKKRIFLRALRVGREHVGAVVNTLALAYVGTSLPLVLLMHLYPATDSALLNMEVFAVEIVRTIAGSFGIVLAVPLVTVLAVRFLRHTDDLPAGPRVVHCG